MSPLIMLAVLSLPAESLFSFSFFFRAMFATGVGAANWRVCSVTPPPWLLEVTYDKRATELSFPIPRPIQLRKS
jgi:hypothetical protein